MRIINIILISSLLFSIGCGSKKTKVDEGITFRIMAIHEYCGGAPPSEEVLEELQTPKPLDDSLYIHPVTDRGRDSLMGILVLKKGEAQCTWLSKGKYVAYSNAKYVAKEGVVLDELAHCRMMMSNLPFFAFEIGAETRLVTDTVPISCDPCLPPMP